ncbi:MAG: ZIP family metal transporter, partial [Planctomycetota bacterium]
MSPAALIVSYCALIVAASLVGGTLPGWFRLTHTRRQLMISFVAGLMLGVSLFHMLPHAAAAAGSLDRAIGWLVAGLLAMFFLIRAFQFHEHEPAHAHEHEPAHAHEHEPAHAHEHEPAHGHEHEPARGHEHHRLSWVGVAIGLGLHTAIDGVALAASVVAEARAESVTRLFGLGAFLAILLHKPLDALAIT